MKVLKEGKRSGQQVMLSGDRSLDTWSNLYYERSHLVHLTAGNECWEERSVVSRETKSSDGEHLQTS